MEQMWSEVIEMLIGGYTLGEMIGLFIFMILGFILFTLLEVENRDKESNKTPKKFSWRFFALDNIKRYVASLLLTYVFFRFYDDLTGQALTPFNALMLGFMGDGIVGMQKKKFQILKANREEVMKKYK